LKERGVVTSAGAWYSIPLEDGTIKKFQSKSWGDMLSKKGMYDYVYGLLCDACIMKYKPKEVIDIDEIEIFDPDKVKILTEKPVGIEGMKVDRRLFEKAREELQQDVEVKTAVENEQWEKAVHIVREKYEDKSKNFS